MPTQTASGTATSLASAAGGSTSSHPRLPTRPTPSVGQIGQYSFLVAPNSGLYTITEGMPSVGFFPSSVWRPTTATSGDVSVGTQDVAGPDFGNVCLGAGGGKTLGFWSNNNGKAKMNDDGSMASELDAAERPELAQP